LPWKKKRVELRLSSQRRVFKDMPSLKTRTPGQRAQAILDYWFGPIDDSTLLNRELEPFATHFMRWYGKNAEVDASIWQTFEPDLLTTLSGRWDETVLEWRRHPRGTLALTVLLDQLPRNMYRGTPRMYANDALGLLASEAARTEISDDLPLVHRMFISVPLMHAENLTLQERMLREVEGLVVLAAKRSPANVGFFRFALDFGKRHVDVIRQFGRFPHRNALLGRTSTAEELEFLKRPDAYF
jgi:uncharacterized protein (DUF924 family)